MMIKRPKSDAWEIHQFIYYCLYPATYCVMYVLLTMFRVMFSHDGPLLCLQRPQWQPGRVAQDDGAGPGLPEDVGSRGQGAARTTSPTVLVSSQHSAASGTGYYLLWRNRSRLFVKHVQPRMFGLHVTASCFSPTHAPCAVWPTYHVLVCSALTGGTVKREAKP